MGSSNVDNDVVLENIQELRKIFSTSEGKLVKSKISPQDYFVNLSQEAPTLKYPNLGISKVIVNICELISNLLLEDIDESSSVSKVIVMIIEYYFLVGPIKFKNQGARFVNDFTFMRQFTQHIQTLCKSRGQAFKEIGNILVALDLYNPIQDVD